MDKKERVFSFKKEIKRYIYLEMILKQLSKDSLVMVVVHITSDYL